MCRKGSDSFFHLLAEADNNQSIPAVSVLNPAPPALGVEPPALEIEDTVSHHLYFLPLSFQAFVQKSRDQTKSFL